MTTRTAILILTVFTLSLPRQVQADPVPGKTPTEKLRKLQQERLKTLEDAYEQHFAMLKLGKSSPFLLLESMRDLTEARLDLADTEADAIKALTTSLELHRKIEEQMIDIVKAGLYTKNDVLVARAARLKVEIQLEKRKTR